MKSKKPHSQPDLNSCPKHFCFNWIEAGSYFAPGFHENLEEGVKKLEKVNTSECGWRYGLCSRNSRIQELNSEEKKSLGAKDFYEPCEPELDKAGLPHTYFDSP